MLLRYLPVATAIVGGEWAHLFPIGLKISRLDCEAHFDRAAEDAQSVGEYVKKYGTGLYKSTTEQGLLLAPLELHDQAMDEAQRALSRIHTLLDRSAPGERKKARRRASRTRPSPPLG